MYLGFDGKGCMCLWRVFYNGKLGNQRVTTSSDD